MAPRKACPWCRNREKAPAQFDSGGGDYWWCTAKPVLPVFTSATIGNSMDGHVGHPINLNHFKEGQPYEREQKAECPLFEAQIP